MIVQDEGLEFWNKLYRTLEKAHLGMVEILLRRGMYVEAKDAGLTMLDVASTEPYTEIVQLFSDHGADYHLNHETFSQAASKVI